MFLWKDVDDILFMKSSFFIFFVNTFLESAIWLIKYHDSRKEMTVPLVVRPMIWSANVDTQNGQIICNFEIY